MKSTAHRASPEHTGPGPAAQRQPSGGAAAVRDAPTAAGAVPLSRSARMVAQRAQIDAAFGRAAQRRTPDGEALQPKTAPGLVQRQGPEDEEEALQGRFATAQRERGHENDVLQGRAEPAQRLQAEDEEELQMKQPSTAVSAVPAVDAAPPRNETGLPDDLISGIESLSGMAMDDVRVHYDSSQPAQLNALAYAQGRDIHIAPGQERHLPHEAWHVVQQAQGRVQPTMQLNDGLPVNDNEGLEREADVMGAKALSGAPDRNPLAPAERLAQANASQRRRSAVDLVQRAPVSVANYRPLMEANDGNFTLGEATRTQANKIGQDWIGRPVTAKYNVSDDQFRQYRKPTSKPQLNKTQANVESRDEPQGRWTKNGHINIVEAAKKKE